jgi:Transcription factor WhiB
MRRQEESVGMRYDPLTRALLDLAEAGERTPCSNADPFNIWLSEVASHRRTAARLCSSCKVKAECLESALANDTRFGVFGGQDFTVAPGRKKPTA